MGQSETPLLGSYDFRLVALSVIVGISASYTALDLGGRVTAAHGRIRSVWLAGGATAMGLGIWSMHFTGMLAFILPIPVSYHWPTVLLSLLAAIVASAVALHVVSGEKMGWKEASIGSLLMGAGIAGMHYIGMVAMRVPTTQHYSPLLVGGSVMIAILASLAALVFTFDFREDFRGTMLSKITSATVMGGAISLMHYTGMAAVTFVRSTTIPELSGAVSISSLGVIGMAVGIMVVQGATVLTSSLDRRLGVRAIQLQSSEQAKGQSQALIDAIPQQIWSGPADGSIDFCNERWRLDTGLSLDQLRGKGWQNMLHPDDRERVLKAWQESVAKGTPYEQEERHRGSDGKYRWFLSRGVPVRDDEGRVVRWYGTNTDIEDRKQAEMTLNRAQAYLSMGEVIAGIGTWAWNPLSSEMFGSQGFHRIFGIDPQRTTLTREVFLQRVHPEDRPTYLRRFNAAANEKRDWEIEYRIVLLDGSIKHIRGVGHPVISDGGEIKEFIGTAMDITERKQAEEQLRQLSGRLLRLQDEERRRIAQDLHDSTGQELVALATMLGQLREARDQKDRKLQKFLSECKDLAEKCIRQVRTLSYSLYPPVLEHAGLAGAIRDYVKGFTKRSGIQVELQLSSRVGRMKADVELALFRVVQESLTNIQLHSGSDHAKIWVQRNSSVILEISDVRNEPSGKLARVSEPTFQFGIGIRSMQERVKLVGGQLEIHTTNRGTTVRVTIPFGDRRENSSDSTS